MVEVVITYLQIPLGGEGLLTDGAAERLVPSMCTHVYLQGRTGREVLITHVAQMLTGLQACKHTHNTREAPKYQIDSYQQLVAYYQAFITTWYLSPYMYPLIH